MALMINAAPHFPKPTNSPFIGFAPGTPERSVLEKELLRMVCRPIDIIPSVPLWINGPVESFHKTQIFAPHNLGRTICFVNLANEKNVHHAINTVLAAREEWSQIPWFMRLNIFQRAARLLETKYMIPMVAAVMEDYSKNPYEAFIDVQELVDFWNFNVYYAYTIYQEQPQSTRDAQNLLDYRPLEGFVFAASPNNFLAINGNLASAPLIMGNVVVAKPPTEVAHSYHMALNILFEAGLPHNVLSVIYGDEEMIGNIVFEHRELSGLHFTGSTETFIKLSQRIVNNYRKYRDYPRIAGETGGKDWLVVFDDHDPKETATAIIGGGFGAQGRKCSSTSRVYMTKKMWERVSRALINEMTNIFVGDVVANLSNYLGAIINKQEYEKVKAYIERLRAHHDGQDGIITEMYQTPLCTPPSSQGYFITPTIAVTTDPLYESMQEEIFGPVVTVCPMDKQDFDATVLSLCDSTSPYALTGAIHVRDIKKFCDALQRLRYAAGNKYNKWSTGAVVDQQPFGGSRMSGTNNKVGWRLNLYQWTTLGTIGLTHVLPTDFRPSYLKR